MVREGLLKEGTSELKPGSERGWPWGRLGRETHSRQRDQQVQKLKSRNELGMSEELKEGWCGWLCKVRGSVNEMASGIRWASQVRVRGCDTILSGIGSLRKVFYRRAFSRVEFLF